MDPAYRECNDAARARLAALVQRMMPEDLDTPLGEGWTVKVALAHMAFWDRFAEAAIGRWQRAGFVPIADDDGYINLAALNDWLAAPPEYALREVLQAAELVDTAAAGIEEALRTEICAGEESWACERGVHRVAHLKQVERALGITSP